MHACVLTNLEMSGRVPLLSVDEAGELEENKKEKKESVHITCHICTQIRSKIWWGCPHMKS